ATAAGDAITVTVQDYAGTSAPATITVVNNTGGDSFTWKPPPASDGSFATPGNWTQPGSGTATAPGGTNIAVFTGTHTVSDDGAVGEIKVVGVGTTTLTGQITTGQTAGANPALDIDAGGALTLAGGAVLTAQQTAIVGGAGQGLLTLMGGALAVTAKSPNSLILGLLAGSSGTMLDLEQITAAETVVVGAAGSGTLELRGDAASLTDSGAIVGQAAGGQGLATVNGGEWMTSGGLTVGAAGNGTLLVNGMNGGVTGQVTAWNGTVGAAAGTQGSVLLNGGELLVANTDSASSSLTVGGSGSGDLEVENGSEATVGAAQASFTSGSQTIVATNNGQLTVGGTAGSSGRVKIGGSSALLVYGNATIGGSAGVGAATVTVGESSDDVALFALIGTLSVEASGWITLGSANATLRASSIDIDAGGVIAGAGTLSGLLGGSKTAALANIDNDGTIAAVGGNLLVYGSVTGAGGLSLASGATMTFQAAVGSSQTLAFADGARAVLDDPRAFSATIQGFGNGDTLDLASTHATSATWSNGVLTLDGDPFGPIQLKMAGNFSPDGFSVQSDGLGGTLVAGGHGDVHMITFDGLRYDFQATGDFLAVRSTSGNDPWQIQIRTDSFPGATSVTTGIVAEIGDARVSFMEGRADIVQVDGRLSGGTLTTLGAHAWELSWNTGEQLWVGE
ncbi:MAG: VWD domain-containing protein, partial [Alphaproteobacteria bacterium]|nr:VWD domain-containing protein [Alphaproteobacteria bacterium]